MDQSRPEEERNADGQPPGDAARDASDSGPGRLAWLRSHWRSLALLLAVVAAAATLIARRWPYGENGQAVADAQQEAARKKKSKDGPQDPFTFGPFSIRPSGTDRVESGIKPGHWTSAAQEVRANFDDFRGQLAAEMVAPDGRPVDLDGLPYRLRTVRPAVLPKSQKKILDVALFSPVENFSRQVAPRLLSTGDRDLWNARELLTPLAEEQFFLVVLARTPNEYRYLSFLDSTWAPRGSIEDRGVQAHYRVLLPSVTTTVPVPNHALFWTSTAVVVWDDFDPNLLSNVQQRAIVDWLHWGGQLIVSGPDSLELLRGSFLDGFLPAAPGPSWEMAETTLAPLARLSPDTERPLHVSQAWTGQHLLVEQRDANVLAATEAGEPLIVERRVGRGRAVVTAFRLTQRELVDWQGYDAVVNAALLRRPPRSFLKSPELKVGVVWADRVAREPGRVSRLRFFTRDAGRTTRRASSNDVHAALSERLANWSTGVPAQDDPFGDEATELAATGAGVAAWDDESVASQHARAALREAAGIRVPRARFVLSVLGAYVLVLVPLNWLVFRWLGRVEMAWLAAPVVALAFAGIVVRLAQLDIGFDRSTSEISLIEVQGEYPRAHLTRYCLLYTSLGTSYTIELANPDAVALPLSTGSAVLERQSRATVILRQQPETGAAGEAPIRLEQLEVASNSAAMVHAEEIHDLGGSLQCTALKAGESYRVRNGTSLHLRDAAVVLGRQGARLGDLGPGEEVEFRLLTLDAATAFRQSTIQPATATGDRAADERLAENVPNVQALGELATTDCGRHELRLLAWTGDELPGLSIEPASNRSHRASLLVAHLSYGPPAPLEIDFNSRAQIKATIPNYEESEGFLEKPVEIP